MLRTEHTQCIHDLFGMRALSGSRHRRIAGRGTAAHPGASPHRVHPESPTEDTIYRERPRQRGNRNIGRDRHGESATRAHTHPSPGSRRARAGAPGSRRRKWRAGCAGPGRARGSRLGVRLRVGSPDSARGGTARTTTPHTRENRESRRRLADLEMSRGIRKSAKAMMLAVSCRRRTRTHINGNFD